MLLFIKANRDPLSFFVCCHVDMSVFFTSQFCLLAFSLMAHFSIWPISLSDHNKLALGNTQTHMPHAVFFPGERKI